MNVSCLLYYLLINFNNIIVYTIINYFSERSRSATFKHLIRGLLSSCTTIQKFNNTNMNENNKIKIYSTRVETFY